MRRAPSKEKKNKKKIKESAPTPIELVHAFLVKAEKVTNDILVGIDPGNTGAVALRCARFYCVIDIPQIVTKVKKSRKTTYRQRKLTGAKTRTVLSKVTTPNLQGICDVFNLLRPFRDRVYVVLEKIPISIGPGRKYADILINRAYAMWPLFLCSRRLRVLEVRPGIWMADLNLTKHEKEDSRQLALRMFPLADIKKKKDHNRAEALLLTEHLRRHLVRENKGAK